MEIGTGEVADRLRSLLADAILAEGQEAAMWGCALGRPAAEHKADLLILEIVKIMRDWK